jgi:hypothetical protein
MPPLTSGTTARRMYGLVEPIGLIPYAAAEPAEALLALGDRRRARADRGRRQNGRGLFRGHRLLQDNQLDQLSGLDSVPVAVLVWILAGMPLIAAAASWLLAGREPPAIARQPLE